MAIRAQKKLKEDQLPKAPLIKSKDKKVGGFHFVGISSISSGYVEPDKSLKALERAVKKDVFKGLDSEVNEQEI